MSPTNIESLVFYNALVEDTNKTIQYWENEATDPDPKRIEENVVRFQNLKAQHLVRIKELEEAIAANNEDPIQGLKDFVERMENLIRILGPYYENIKDLITRLINIAKKLLETFLKK